MRGKHSLKFGGECADRQGRLRPRRVPAGRIEIVQDFPEFDLNGDGRVDDNDLLFAVTLRSGKPDQDLVLGQLDNSYFAGFAQDDLRVTPRLTLNLGLRWEVDTDVKNV